MFLFAVMLEGKKQAREIQYVNLTVLHNTVNANWVTSKVFVNDFKDVVMLTSPELLIAVKMTLILRLDS